MWVLCFIIFGGDYSFTSDIILLVHLSSGRRVVMVNSWVYVMTADNHVSRGSPLIGEARRVRVFRRARGVVQEISERTGVFKLY